MLTPAEVAELHRVCAEIGDEVVGEDGFVAVRDLLDRFRAALVPRPLLVEAMIAIQGANSTSSSNEESWVILVDNERYSVDSRALLGECAGAALESRFRNTIAHELAHSLAFRQSEFGLKLRQPPTNGTPRREYVRAMEREIERLSPVLLAPPKAISRIFAPHTRPAAANDLVKARISLGVSREVLVQRLNLLRSHDERDVLQLKAFRNVCFGIYERQEGGSYDFLGWPLFSNFEKNIVPDLVRRIGRNQRLPASDLFERINMRNSAVGRCSVELEMMAGTDANPSVMGVTVELDIETSRGEPAKRGFFSIHMMS